MLVQPVCVPWGRGRGEEMWLGPSPLRLGGAALWSACWWGAGAQQLASPPGPGRRSSLARGQGKHPPEAQPGDAPASRAGAQGEEVSAFRAPPPQSAGPPVRVSHRGTPRPQWPDRRERGTGPEPKEAGGRARGRGFCRGL